MEKLQYENLTIRPAEIADAKQLACWWNDGAVMAHAGFPNGIGTCEKEVIRMLGSGCLVIEENGCQNRGIGKKVLSLLIACLFKDGYSKIVLDTNLKNTRAQHVYESLGFRKVRTNIDAWTDQTGRPQSSVDYELLEKNFVNYALNGFDI